MDKRCARKLEDAKNDARPELRSFGWDTLNMADRMSLDIQKCPDNIQRVSADELTYEEFVERFEKPRIPVIITDCQKEWMAKDKWNVERVMKKYRNQKFKCGEDDRGYSVKLKMKYYVEYLKHQTDDSPMYIFDSGFGDRHKVRKLLDDYSVPKFFSDDLFGYTTERKRPPYKWFVMGPARSGTGIHIDPLGTSAWNAVVQGHKRWCLIPTGAPRDLVKVKKGEGGKHPDEAITWFSVVHPRTQSPDWPKQFTAIDCVQGPGETMFVPGGWWHVVLNLDTAIAVTQNFASPTNLPAVWHKTCRGRPKLAKQWIRVLREKRPPLAAICDSVDVAGPCALQSDSSSDSSSSSSDSDSTSDGEDSGTEQTTSDRRKRKGTPNHHSSRASADSACVSKIRRSRSN